VEEATIPLQYLKVVIAIVIMVLSSPSVWTVHFLWGILRVAIGNAWALFNEQQEMPLVQFRRIWAEHELTHNR